jgi:hypothetical protein
MIESHTMSTGKKKKKINNVIVWTPTPNLPKMKNNEEKFRK